MPRLCFWSWIVTAVVVPLDFSFSAALVAREVQKLDVEKGSQILELIAEGYLANREALRAFDLRYRMRVGKAKSIQDALNGRLEPGYFSAQVRWIVDGQRVKFERIVDLARIKAELDRASQMIGKDVTTASIAVPIRAEKYLLDSNAVQLRYTPLANVAVVQRPEIAESGIILTPFDFGIMGHNEKASPGKLIQRALSQENGVACRFGGYEPDDGRQLMRVIFKMGDSWQYDYTLNPACGFLPVKVEIRNPAGELVRRVFVTKLMECPGDRWMPANAVVVSGGAADTLSIDEFTVTEASFEPPDVGLFAVELPAGSAVNDGIDPNSQFRLTNAISVTPSVAVELLERASRQAKGGLPGNTETTGRSLRVVLLALNIVVILVLAFFWWRHRTSSRAQL